jgi:AcrR family transcriptional regulator
MAFVSSAELPHPPWSSLRGKPPARTPLSREAIADAALAIVDAEGLDGLSMRRLAEELGTGPASLYAHVSGKSELLQLLIDRVAAGDVEAPPPDPERWQQQLKDFARRMRDALAAHRDLAGASLANIPTGPNVMRRIDGLLGILRASGLPDQVIAYAADLLPQYVTVDAYEGSLFAQRMEREPQYFEELTQYFAALPAERFPNVAALVPELMRGGEGDERFEFGLEVIVRGLAAMADPPATTE